MARMTFPSPGQGRRLPSALVSLLIAANGVLSRASFEREHPGASRRRRGDLEDARRPPGRSAGSPTRGSVMSLRRSAMCGLATFAIALAVTPAASGQGSARLEMYTLEGSAAGIADAAGGVELAGVEQTASGIRAEAVLTDAPAREGGGCGREGEADAQQEGPDGDRAGRRPGGRRVRGLALVGRARRHPGRALRGRPQITRSWSSWRCSGARIRAAS